MKRDARDTPKSVTLGFEDDCVTLPIDAILPLRALGKSAKSSRKYRQIVASIAQIGIVEPPVVVRNPDKSATWLLLDGHLRIEALKDAGESEVECLVSTDDEAFTGAAMTPSSTKKGARRYRYYVSMDVIKNREPSDEGIPRRLPADLVEAAVVTELRRVMRAPSITAQVIAHLAREVHAFAEADVISALQTFDDVWGQLFPAEQTRIVQLLVRRVTVTSEGLVIDVRTDGVSGVMRDMMAPRKKVAAE